MDINKLQEVANSYLQWHHLEISIDELKDVIDKYNFYLDLLLDATGSSAKYYQGRFDFIKEDNNYDDVDNTYEKIFNMLCIYKKRDAFHLIDIVKLLNSLHGPTYNIVNTLSIYLAMNLSKIKDESTYDDPIYYIISTYTARKNLITEWLDSVIYEMIMESNYLSDNYKNIIKTYYESSQKLIYGKIEEDYKDCYETVINVSYFFFVYHNAFEKDYEGVMNFLIDLRDNPYKITDQVSMTGMNWIDELITYFDTLYKKSSKEQKRIK